MEVKVRSSILKPAGSATFDEVNALNDKELRFYSKVPRTPPANASYAVELRCFPTSIKNLQDRHEPATIVGKFIGQRVSLMAICTANFAFIITQEFQGQT